MLLGAQNGIVCIGNTDMDYVSFGKGKNILVMLPGLAEGLKTVKGMALPLAWWYREYAKEYTVFIFSRKNVLPENYSTQDMAEDQAKAMIALGITNANIMGVSQGGMIAQNLVIGHPELVKKLVLVVTLAQQNEIIQNTASDWISMAEHGDYKSLMIDTAEKTYSEKFLKKYRHLYPFLGMIGKPKDFKRFLIQAKSCLHHDAYSQLDQILCPTLVLGGACDQIVGKTAAVELADQIINSELYIYSGLGHAAYEEARDFNQRVLRFLEKQK